MEYNDAKLSFESSWKEVRTPIKLFCNVLHAQLVKDSNLTSGEYLTKEREDERSRAGAGC
jgi:hypothetical protein